MNSLLLLLVVLAPGTFEYDVQIEGVTHRYTITAEADAADSVLTIVRDGKSAVLRVKAGQSPTAALLVGSRTHRWLKPLALALYTPDLYGLKAALDFEKGASEKRMSDGISQEVRAKGTCKVAKFSGKKLEWHEDGILIFTTCMSKDAPFPLDVNIASGSRVTLRSFTTRESRGAAR